MSGRGVIARWRARRPDERRAIVEAFAALALASAAVKLLPFRIIARRAQRLASGMPPADPARAVATVAWAVRGAARRARFRAVCIEQGLAAQAMLRRRGIAATLHYGVARGGERLTAHVWVRWGEVDVVGGEQAAAFRELASFAAEGRRQNDVG